MRVGCVLIHHFAVWLARRQNPELGGRPLIVGGFPPGANSVFDASPEAIACGVKPGMRTREACCLCPEAVVIEANEGRCRDAFDQVLSILDEFSPTVEVAGLGCAYLDVTGVGDEHELARTISSRIAKDMGLSACIGVTSGKFLSWLAAFSSAAEAPVIIPAGTEKEFVAPFSTGLLPCSDGTKERLGLFGIRVVGELAQFPRDALVAQFGDEGKRLCELAHGIDSSRLVPRREPEVLSGLIEFDPPAETSPEMLRACDELLSRLVAQARAEGKVCTQIKLRLRLSRGLPKEKDLPLKESTVSRESLVKRLRACFEGQSFPDPVHELELSLLLERDIGRRLALWPEPGAMKRELARAAGEMSKRLGYQPIKKAVMVEPAPLLPEGRFRLIDVDKEA